MIEPFQLGEWQLWERRNSIPWLERKANTATVSVCYEPERKLYSVMLGLRVMAEKLDEVSLLNYANYLAETGLGGWAHDPKDVPDVADPVNRPTHYANQGQIECIQVLEQLASDGEDFRILNAIKYLWRWRHKGGVESLKKAVWYIERVIASKEANEQG